MAHRSRTSTRKNRASKSRPAHRAPTISIRWDDALNLPASKMGHLDFCLPSPLKAVGICKDGHLGTFNEFLLGDTSRADGVANQLIYSTINSLLMSLRTDPVVSSPLRYHDPDVARLEEFYSDTALLRTRIWAAGYDAAYVSGMNLDEMLPFMPGYALAEEKLFVRLNDCLHLLNHAGADDDFAAKLVAPRSH